MLRQDNQEINSSKEKKEQLTQRELAEIVPPLVRPIIYEKLPEIAAALEQATHEPQEIELEVHNYRYLSIAVNPHLGEHLRRKLAAELTVSLGGSLTVQGGKDSILVQDTDDFQRRLQYFVLSQHEHLVEMGYSEEITQNPFWIAVSNPEPVAHFKMLIYKRGEDEQPVASLIEEIDVTPNILVAAHMAEECMKDGNALPLQEGELPIIISRPDLPSGHGWNALRPLQKHLKSKNQTHEFFVPQVDDDAFHNFSIEEAVSLATPEEKQFWEDLVLEHWSDVFSTFECNTFLTFDQLAKKLNESDQTQHQVEFPNSYMTEIQLDGNSSEAPVADIDVSGMTMIFKTLEKEIQKTVGKDMYENLQRGSKKLFSRWMNASIQLLNQYGGYTSSIAGDGARCILLKKQAQEYYSEGEHIQLEAFEYLNLIINISSSWDKVITSVLEYNSEDNGDEESAPQPMDPNEWLAARFIQEAFGNRIFVKTSLANSNSTIFLQKTESGGMVPFTTCDAEEELNKIFSIIKAAYPSVSTYSNEQFINNSIRIIGGLNGTTVNQLMLEIQSAPKELRKSLQKVLSSSVRLVSTEVNHQLTYLLVDVADSDLTILEDLKVKLEAKKIQPTVRWYDPIDDSWKNPDEPPAEETGVEQ